MGVLRLFGPPSQSTCPVNATVFENRFYELTTTDYSPLAGIAAQLVIAGIAAFLLLILGNCPDFCLTTYAAKAGPSINAGIQKAADDAARLAAKLVADNVEKSTCKYDYVTILASSLPGVSSHMSDCANNARVSATKYAIKALKEECPKLNTDVIEAGLTAFLTVVFSPLVAVAVAETTKNLLIALPCTSYLVLGAVDLSILPGFGESPILQSLQNLPGLPSIPGLPSLPILPLLG